MVERISTAFPPAVTRILEVVDRLFQPSVRVWDGPIPARMSPSFDEPELPLPLRLPGAGQPLVIGPSRVIVTP